jgi:hypothetical protein
MKRAAEKAQAEAEKAAEKEAKAVVEKAEDAK